MTHEAIMHLLTVAPICLGCFALAVGFSLNKTEGGND